MDHRPVFTGERVRILPPGAVRAALANPLTSRVLVTDVGWFPHARSHQRSRPEGTEALVVILCAAGRGWCRENGREFWVGPGQALVLPSGRPHAYGASADEPWTIAWLHVVGEDVARFETGLVGDHGGATLVEVRDRSGAVQLVDEVLGALEHDDTAASVARASGAAWHLLARLVADHTNQARGRTTAVDQAMGHLQDHLDRPVTVAELAALSGLSASHFSALFRAATGGGPIEYHKRLRMARAASLLATTTISVADVARMVGYVDPLYFSRAFRSVQGVSPTDFRRVHGPGPSAGSGAGG